MTRRHVAAGVLLVWAGAMGWLLRREYWPSAGSVLARATFSLPPGATYYTLSLGGQQIGFASNTVDTLADTIRVDDVMVLEVPALGELHRTDARTEAWLSRQLELRGFSAILRGDIGQFTARGTVQGDSMLTVELETGGSEQTMRIPLDRPIVLPGLLPLHVTFGGPVAIGSRYTLRTFDPLTMRERDVELRITGDSTFIVPDSAVFDSVLRQWVPARWDTLRAFQVSQEMGGIQVEAWIDEVGHIVRARSPMCPTINTLRM